MRQASGTSSPSPAWRRLVDTPGAVALVLAVVAAGMETAATVVSGRVAAGPTTALVVAIAVLLLGSAALDTAARTTFSDVVGRAEGRLRADLLDAALHQPLPVLDEQGVGELLDRVDDDTRQVATLLRRTGWQTGRALIRALFAWVVAGLTFWPAWIVFPLVAVTAVLSARRLSAVVAARKLTEEVAWSDHSAQLEEAVAGRDDVRSSLGQAHVVRQYAERAAEVLRRVGGTCRTSTTIMLRTGLVLHSTLAALAVVGVALVGHGRLTVGSLVTLWLLVQLFVGQLGQVSHQLPEVQAGLGALGRIRSLLLAPREPSGGLALPAGPAAVQLRGLTFRYPGGFSLASLDLLVPAGTSCALVGRSGAGKSTVVKLLSRAVDPPVGTVFVGGQDVTTTAMEDLRGAVGVVTQRTELLAASLADNITLFADVPRRAVEDAVDALGLTAWVDGLPAGLDTELGSGGATLSAGEEQLVAFARLLVRDVAVVVLDEATARMDPQTERLVTQASERLLAGRTGIVVAHRLSTTRSCDAVAVMRDGRIVQHGARAALAAEDGPFRELLRAAGEQDDPAGAPPAVATLASRAEQRVRPAVPPPPVPSLTRSVLAMLGAHRGWGLAGGVAFLLASLLGSFGAVTAALWGSLVSALQGGEVPWRTAALLAASVLLGPVTVALAFRTYPLWWSAVTLRLRLTILRGQTQQERLPRTPSGEVAARALDTDRLVIYADRWVDVITGVSAALVTAAVGRSLLAGAVAGAVLVLSAGVSAAGAPLAGASAREAGDARARFGRSLVSVLDAVRTVKLAAATEAVQEHLLATDHLRVSASIRENRVRTLLDGVPGLFVQAGVVTAWVAYLAGGWDLATTLLVTTSVTGFGWFGTVAGAAITEAPAARRWLEAAGALAGSTELVALPPGVDLVRGVAPAPPPATRVPLRQLQLTAFTAVHDDGTVGVRDVDLVVDAGRLVLLVGRVGAGKSSLLTALAGLVDHEGSLRWNGVEVGDPQLFLRPGQVAYVGQVPRVLSGSYADNVALGHQRRVSPALDDARLGPDVEAAGGHGALIGHRGVRLSGGQVQRLALARALATGAELLVADDVSSALDARTEVELWSALRRRGATVLGSTSKRAALERADHVVVLEEGRVVATGAWSELAQDWAHLAG